MFPPTIIVYRDPAQGEERLWEGSPEAFFHGPLRDAFEVFIGSKAGPQCIDPPSYVPSTNCRRSSFCWQGTECIAVFQDPQARGLLDTWDDTSPKFGSRGHPPSPNSDAVYLVQGQKPSAGFYLQLLRCPNNAPFGQTSCHYHRRWRERWFVQSGRGILLTRDCFAADPAWRATPMFPNRAYGIGTYVEHQIRTDDCLCTYLSMNDLPSGNVEADHEFVSPPPHDLHVSAA